MKHIFQLIIFLGLILGCSSSNTNGFNTNSSRLVPEPDLIERLKYQKKLWNSTFQKRALRYYKLRHSDILFEINSTNEPLDSIQTSFIMYKDSMGKVYIVDEAPYEYEPGIILGFRHYFDNEGKTFAFENMEENEGGQWIQTAYYNNKFEMIALEKSDYSAWNNKLEKGNLPLKTKLDFKASPTYTEFMKERKMKFKNER